MKRRGLFQRKLAKSKPNIDQIIDEIFTDNNNVDKESAITTDFEPYCLSDTVGSDSGVLNDKPVTKNKKYRKFKNKQNPSCSSKKNLNKKVPNNRLRESKELYDRIASCGQNVAANDITENCSKVILKETYYQCPFDPNHHVPAKGFKKHVKKCQKVLAPGLELKECPFNSNHIIPVCMWEDHVKRCRDQKGYDNGIANGEAKNAVDLGKIWE